MRLIDDRSLFVAGTLRFGLLYNSIVCVSCICGLYLRFGLIQCYTVSCICGLYDQVWVVVQCYTMCKLYLWPVPLGLGCFGPS